jgi:hypothetical protein
MLLSVGALVIFTGCCPKTYERIVKDTVTVTRLDTVLVNLRPVEISVPVPQVVLTEIVPIGDTLLVLDNGLYASEVLIKDGQVTHTLRPSDGADSLHATVVVADTTHITHTNTTQTHTEKEKVTVEKQEAWYTKLWRKVSGTLTWIIVGGLLVVCFLFAVRRRI